MTQPRASRVSRALRICRDESAARAKVKIRGSQFFSRGFSGISHKSAARACAFVATKAQRAGKGREVARAASELVSRRG